MFQPIERRKNRRSGNSPGIYYSLDRNTLLVLHFVLFLIQPNEFGSLTFTLIAISRPYFSHLMVVLLQRFQLPLSLPEIGPHPSAIPVPGQSWEVISVLRHAVSAHVKGCPLPTDQTQYCLKIKFTIFIRDIPLFSIFHFLGPIFFLCCPVFLSHVLFLWF